MSGTIDRAKAPSTNLLIETIFAAIATINESNLIDVDITQVTIAKGRKVTTGTMMTARNPIIMISATKPS